jgi:hypothetical protein
LNGTFNLSGGDQRINFVTTGNTTCFSGDANRQYAYPGQLRPLMVEGTCDGTWGSAHVRQHATVIFSGSRAIANPGNAFPGTATLQTGGSCRKTFAINLSDGYGNILPAKTKIELTKVDVSKTVPPVAPATTPTVTQADVSLSLTEVPNQFANSINVTVAIVFPSSLLDCTTPAGGFNLVTTTPKGVVTTIPYVVTQ